MTTPKPEEFELFAKLLMQNAPKGFIPHYFKVEKHGKNPLRGISWKHKNARITPKEAINWLKKEGNIGIAGMEYDPLVLVDGDCAEVAAQFKPTLITTSRLRIAGHGIYFVNPKDHSAKINCATGKGEIRSVGQYIVAPGSFVPTSDTEVYFKHWIGELTHAQLVAVLDDPLRGFYTVKNAVQPSTIIFSELPDVFKQRMIEIATQKKQKKTPPKYEPKQSNGKRSALFDLSISDMVSAKNCSERFSHPLHSSDSGANFCVSGELGHCWRHMVSLNAIQFLVVKSEFMSCEDAGTSHTNGGAGDSQVVGNDGCIFHAWFQAKKDGLIPKDDPVPVNALHYIAQKHKVCDLNLIPKRGEFPRKKLPTEAYNKILKIIRSEY